MCSAGNIPRNICLIWLPGNCTEEQTVIRGNVCSHHLCLSVGILEIKMENKKMNRLRQMTGGREIICGTG